MIEVCDPITAAAGKCPAAKSSATTMAMVCKAGAMCLR